MQFRYSEAEKKAQSVLYECGLSDLCHIDMTDLVFGRGAYYQEKPLKGKEGEIVSVKGRSTITVNSDIQFETKKRFVAAHELGHHEIHRDLNPIIVDSEADLLSWYKGGEQEIQANEFAAELLMPSEVFYHESRKGKCLPKSIDYLSNFFKVSKTATILRFAKRGSFPICVVCCQDNRMEWYTKSDDFRPFVLFDRRMPPPTGSVAYEIFTQKKHYSGEEAVQEIWKSEWCQLGEYERDSLFNEYCFYVPSYNYTLSIIWGK